MGGLNVKDPGKTDKVLFNNLASASSFKGLGAMGWRLPHSAPTGLRCHKVALFQGCNAKQLQGCNVAISRGPLLEAPGEKAATPGAS